MIVLDAPIKGINLYNNRARITRSGSLHLEAGEHLIAVVDLPASIESDSVRVMSPKPAIKILDVDIVTQSIAAMVSPEVAELQMAFDLLQDRDEALRDDDRIESDQLAFLLDIRNAASRSLGEVIAQGNLPFENVHGLMDNLAEQQRKAQNRRREIAQKRRQLEQEMRQLQARAPSGVVLVRRTVDSGDAMTNPFIANPFANSNENPAPEPPSNPFRKPFFSQQSAANDEEQGSPFGKRPAPPPAPTRTDYQRKSIHLAVQVDETATFDFTIIYTVTGASWEPFYDIRVVDDEFIVTFMAHISQHTGENWPEVPLVLSTARPVQNATLPKIRPWLIDAEEAAPPSPPSLLRRPSFGANARLFGSNNNEESPRRSPFGRPQSPAVSPRPSPFSRPQPVATATEKPLNLELQPSDISGVVPTVTFTVQQPVAVASDNSVRKAFIATLSLEGQLDYIAIPNQAEEAYLCARIKNTSEMTLLPGNALIFYGAQFIGKTELKTIAPGDIFAVQVGERERIRVRRQLTEHSVSRPSVENISRTEFIYRITLANETNESIGLTVYDHLPVTRNKNIKVLVRAIAPQPLEHTDLNIFKWRIELEPGERQEIILGFALEHPKDMKIVSKRS